MNFEEGSIYHIFNRGNASQTIFFTRDNYLFFLKKVRKEIHPFADLLAYCLMPNHFHFLLNVKPGTVKDGSFSSKNLLSKDVPHPLSRKIGTLLSSYTRAINIQEKRSGSLFQQKTKAEFICHIDENDDTDYLTTCFHYIHQNQLNSGLVSKMEDWEFSSFRDYAGLRDGNLINKSIAHEILSADWKNFNDLYDY